MSDTTPKARLHFLGPGGATEVEAPSPEHPPLGREGCLLRAAVAGGVDLLHVCGGHGSCGTCHVVVAGGGDLFPAPGPREDATLARLGARREAGSRLACQAVPARTGDVLVQVPARPAASGPLDLVIETGKSDP